MIAGPIPILATLIFIELAAVNKDHPAYKPDSNPDVWCADPRRLRRIIRRGDA